jgi:Na+-translocating ferredoxin:NAD+ oxidoreductase RnfC subunit
MAFNDTDWIPDEVILPLKQHLGDPAETLVTKDDKVLRGEVIGEIPEGKLGARVHASIDGIVTSVEHGAITIKAI